MTSLPRPWRATTEQPVPIAQPWPLGLALVQVELLSESENPDQRHPVMVVKLAFHPFTL